MSVILSYGLVSFSITSLKEGLDSRPPVLVVDYISLSRQLMEKDDKLEASVAVAKITRAVNYYSDQGYIVFRPDQFSDAPSFLELRLDEVYSAGEI